MQLETSSLGLTHSPPSYKGPQCVFGYHSQAYRENTAFSSKGRTFSKRPYLKSKSAVFTVVKHLLKRDENDKRTYQSDEHTIYENMTRIMTESAFVESINLDLASPQ